jgi:hypothetical protein
MVAYAVFSEHMLLRQQAELTDHGDGTSEIRWSRSYTALDRMGRFFLDRYDQEKFDREMGFLLGQLESYLEKPGSGRP